MKLVELVKGKHVLVFGLGLQGGGVGDAIWLSKHGAVVKVTDLKSAEALSSSLAKLPSEITHTLGRHLDSDIEWADLIIKNPGVPDSAQKLFFAKTLHKPIYTSIALVVQEARDKVIGITGTRGKSTTTELIFALLNSLYPGEIIKGGNVAGTSGLALLDQLPSAKYLVLELSSFQLAGFHDLEVSPHYAVLTNIYPDHLNRYPDMAAYQHDKSAIYAYQTPDDYLIVNLDNRLANEMASQAQSQVIGYTKLDTPKDWSIRILGEHNRENIAAVIALSRMLKIDLTQVKSIVNTFHSLPSRLELVRELNEVKYYNDTTSTTPTSTIKAIQALQTPLILILGGADKKLPTDELISTLTSTDRLKSIILLGGRQIPAFVQALQASCSKKIAGQVFTMDEAVKLANSLAIKGDTVLLSPGFASFDLFENEFERGHQFNQAVATLAI